jgi:hypothetical protein
MSFRAVPAFLLLLCPIAGAAQSAGSPRNCHGLLTASLASGRSHGDLSRCGESLIPGIARSIGDARLHPAGDPRWFAAVYRYGSRLRDNRILQPSLRLAVDRTASTAARSTAMMVAVAQVRSRTFPAGVGTFEEFLSRGVPGTCAWSAITDSEYWVDNPLPSGAVEQVLHAARQMAADAGQPALQRLGRCSQLLLRTLLTPGRDAATRVRVAGVCDRRFTVTNPTDVELDLDWRVVGTDEEGEITVQAGGHRVLGTDGRGALLLSWEGETIATAENVDRPCGPQNE